MPDPINSPGVQTSDNTGHQQHQANYAGATFAGAAINAAANFGMAAWQNKVNERRYKQEREDNRRDAAVAYQRQQALMKESERYNSIQNQVNMLRQAGLNPALAYGSLGSASVSTPSADQASPASYAPAADASGVAAPLAQIPTMLSTMQDVQQKAITNKYLDTKNTQEIFKMIAETNKMLADTSLSEEQKQNLIVFRDQQLELLKAQTDSQSAAAKQSEATANYTSGALTHSAEASAKQSEAAANLSDEQAKTQESIRDLNKANTKQAYANVKLIDEKALTEANAIRPELLSRKDLNEATKFFTEEQYKQLDIYNQLTMKQRDMVEAWCDEHGYNPGVAKMIMLAVDNAGPEATKNLAEWLNGGHWLRFVSDLTKSFMWKQTSEDVPAKKKVSPVDSGTGGSPNEPTLENSKNMALDINGGTDSKNDPYIIPGLGHVKYADMQTQIKRWLDHRIDSTLGRGGMSVEQYEKTKKRIDDILFEINKLPLKDSERDQMIADVYKAFEDVNNDDAIDDLLGFLKWYKDIYQK